MENQSRPEKLKGFLYYLPKAVKFYDLKNEKLTRAVFVVILLTSFLSAFVPAEVSSGMSFQDIIINVAIIAVIYLASTVYLVAYIRELKNKEYTAQECFRRVMRKASRIVIGSLLYGVAFVMGLFALVLPGLIIAVIYIFYICYITDLGEPITDAFQASKRITRGYRQRILMILILFNLVLLLPVFLLLAFAASSGSPVIVTFVTAFTGAVINLMYQRLVALLYMDLEYGSSAEKSI